MRKINRIKYRSLRRDEQLAFNDKVLEIVTKHCGKCHASVDRFAECVERFAQIKRDKAFDIPIRLRELDREADNAWSALSMQLKASLVHPLAEIRHATQKITDVFSKTDNPTDLSYEQEYAALKNLLSQLALFDEATLKTALVDWHVKALKDAVELFTVASEEKFDAEYNKDVGEIKKASEACFKAWQDLLAYLEMTFHFEQKAEIGVALDKLDYLCAHLNRRLGNRKSSAEENIDIDDIASGI